MGCAGQSCGRRAEAKVVVALPRAGARAGQRRRADLRHVYPGQRDPRNRRARRTVDADEGRGDGAGRSGGGADRALKWFHARTKVRTQISFGIGR